MAKLETFAQFAIPSYPAQTEPSNFAKHKDDWVVGDPPKAFVWNGSKDGNQNIEDMNNAVDKDRKSMMEETKLGNKTDNGVLEVGTDEIRQSYSEDTPGQKVEEFIKEREKSFHEEKKRTEKHFSQVFQNPLEGYPYNEEISVRPIKEDFDIFGDYDMNIQEGTWAVPDSYKKLYNLQHGFLKTKIPATEKNARKLLVDLYGIFGDDSFYDAVEEFINQPDPSKDLRNVIVYHLDDFGIKFKKYEITHAPKAWYDNNAKEEVQEGKYLKYSDLLLKKQRELVAIDKAQDKSGVKNPSLNALKAINKEIDKEMKKLGIKEAYPTTSKSGSDVAKLMMKSKTMKAFASKVKKMKQVTADDLEKILPDYVSGGDIGAMFEEVQEGQMPKRGKGNIKKPSGSMKVDLTKEHREDYDMDEEVKMTSSQKKEFDKLYKKMDGGKEHQAIKRKIHNPIKADDAFHALVMKKVMGEEIEEALAFGFETEKGANDFKRKFSDSEPVRILTVKGTPRYIVALNDTSQASKAYVEKAAKYAAQISLSEESLNEETVIDVARRVVDKKGAEKIKGVMLDMFTASAIIQVYDKVNDKNKEKMEKMDLPKLAAAVWKILGK